MAKLRFDKPLLVKTLAAYEAVRLPIRHQWDHCPAIFEARAKGLPVSGGSTNERQTICRQRADMAAAGLMVGAKLTAKGRCLARQFSWPYLVADLRKATKRLTDALERGDYRFKNEIKMVPEQLIAGSDDAVCKWVTQGCLLPLLVEGVLVDGSTVHGGVFYGLADESVDLGAAIKAAVGARSQWNEELADIYVAEFRRCRQRVLGDRAYYSELGELPLAPDELVSGRDWYEDFGVAPLFKVSTKEKQSC
jgi:hypothetical protein